MSRVGVSKTFRKVTHAIFDMDGLLLDTESLYTEITQQILDEYGKTYTWEEKVQLMGLTATESHQRLIEMYDLPLTLQEVAERSTKLGAELMPRAKLMPDTEGAYYRVLTSVLAHHGKPYTPELRAKIQGMQAVDMCKTLVRETSMSVTWQDVHAQFVPAILSQVETSSLLPGVERLIKHLYKNNVPLAVATSSSGPSFAIKSKCHKDFFSMFKHVVTGGSDPEVKQGKPAPDIFQIAAARFGDHPKFESCLVFEDAPNGVQGALAAGMQVVMVPDEHTGPEHCKDATIVLQSMQDFKPEDFGLPAFPNQHDS